MKKFTDNTIADRIRIIMQDSNPVHVSEILSKHYGESVELINKRYLIKVDTFRNSIDIEGNMSNICELVNYLSSYDLKFESVTETSVRINLYSFFRKIY